jgi:hypothetical protein
MNDPGLYIPVQVKSSRELTLYENSDRTIELSKSDATAQANSKVYARLRITNLSTTAIPANSTVATTNPNDRVSELHDSTWLSQNRVASIGKVVKPGETIYVNFQVNIPQTLKSYEESFGLVVDGSGGGWIELNSALLKIKAVSKPLDALTNSQQLTAGKSISSNNGRYTLIMQGDGNLVLYSPSRAVWASNTDGKAGNRVIMQGDGNLVLYSPSRAVWASNTDGKGASALVLQDDGNLVIYKPNGTATWASNTNGK